jgi:DNA-binding GntR family transcriptional regulator
MSATQQRVSAAERAHSRIREAIMNGEFPPGTMLSENELASMLSMSRTPIRAALTRLQDEGWVTIYAQRGALVRELTADEVRESAEVRNALESAGVRHATAAWRAELADRLAENLANQEQTLRAGDVDAFAILALKFHRAFAEAARNSIMLALYDRLRDRQYLSIIGSAGRITEDPEQVIAEHRALLDYASRGDWVGFATALDEHQSRSHGLQRGW